MNLVYALQDKASNWDSTLPIAVSAYNATVHEATEFTPNELWFSRQMRFTVGAIVPDPRDDKPETYCDYLKRKRDQLRSAYDTVR